MMKIGDIEYRNLQEQVEKNKNDILYILEEEGVLNEFGITVVGQEESTDDMPATDSEEFEALDYGAAYAIGTQAPFTLYIKTRANGTHPNDYWFNIGTFPMPGPQGETGEQGPQGEQGVQGETGAQGIQGEQGNPGLGIYTTSYNLGYGAAVVPITDITTSGRNLQVGDLIVANSTGWCHKINAVSSTQVISQSVLYMKGNKGDVGNCIFYVNKDAGTSSHDQVTCSFSDISVGTVAGHPVNLDYAISRNNYICYISNVDSTNRTFVINTIHTIQGAQGIQGEQGPQGETGPAGQDGTDGTNGTDGLNGLSIYKAAAGYHVNFSTVIGTSNTVTANKIDVPSGRTIQLKDQIIDTYDTLGYVSAIDTTVTPNLLTVITSGILKGYEGYSIYRALNKDLNTTIGYTTNLYLSDMTVPAARTVKIMDFVIGRNGYLGYVNGMNGDQYIVQTFVKMVGENGASLISVQIVQTLPATGDLGTLYFVPNGGTGTNQYDEYIYTNNAWEKLGTTSIDLSNYIQKSQTTGLVKNDGTIDTTTYIATSETAGLVKNDGSIDTTQYLSSIPNDVVRTSQTAGLIKNDGTIDTNTYLTSNDLPPQNNVLLYETNPDNEGAYKIQTYSGYDFSLYYVGDSGLNPYGELDAVAGYEPTLGYMGIAFVPGKGICTIELVDTDVYGLNVILPAEQWTFTLDDSSTVTKNVLCF